MFETMHKYRVWILGFLFVGLFGWGAWQAVTVLFTGGGGENPVMGRFRLPGSNEDVEVTLAEYRNVGQALESDLRMSGGIGGLGRILGLGEPEGERENIHWMFFPLREAARRAGIPVPDAQIESFHRFRTGTPPERPVYISEERRQYLRDLYATIEFKDLFTKDPGGVRFSAAFENFKREAEEVRGRVLIVDAGEGLEHTLDFEDPAAVNRLVEWFEANKGRFADKRVPEQVDLEVAYVRMADLDVPGFAAACEAWEEALAGIEATDDECLARWNAHRDAYGGLLRREADRLRAAQEEENRRAREEGREPRNLTAADQPSEYERLREHLRREIRLGKLLARLIDEVKGGSRMADVAARWKLPLTSLEKMDRQKLQTQPEVGNARAMQMIWASAVAKLPPSGSFTLGSIVEYESTNAHLFLPRIFDEPGQFLAVYRVIDHRKDRDPELKEIRDAVYAQWRKAQAAEGASRKVRELRDAAMARARELESVRPVVAAAEAESAEAVAKEIAERSLSREREEHQAEIAAIEARHAAARDRKIQDAVKPHLAEALAAVAAEQGLTLQAVPWTRRSRAATGMVYGDDIAPDEKLNRFLRSPMVIFTMANLAPGEVSEPLDADPQTGFACLVMLDEKRVPDPGDLAGWPEKLAQLAPAGTARPSPLDWTFAAMKSEDWFHLRVPELERLRAHREKEKAIAAARDAMADREDAERGLADLLRAVEEKRRAERESPPVPPTPPGENR
jgi:hypothetical protein